MSNRIRIVLARVGEAPVVTELANTLEAMQATVGGYIECVRVDDLDVWLNEDGLGLSLPFNRTVDGLPIVGPIFVAASNEDGDTLGLSDVQVERALALLSAPKSEVWA